MRHTQPERPAHKTARPAERMALTVKWVEGVLGATSGVLGIVALAIVIWFGPAYTRREFCAGAIQPVCYVASNPPSVMTALTSYSAFVILIPLGVVFALFLGVLAGTWLDLRGRRLAGRLILLVGAIALVLASISILPMALYFEGRALGSLLGGAAVAVFPSVLLALVTSILACARRDAPHGPATSTGE